MTLRRLNGKYVKHVRDLAVGDVMDVAGVGLLAIEEATPRADGFVKLRAVGVDYMLPADGVAYVEPSHEFIEALLVLNGVQAAIDDGRPQQLAQALAEVRKVVINYRKMGVL